MVQSRKTRTKVTEEVYNDVKMLLSYKNMKRKTVAGITGVSYSTVVRISQTATYRDFKPVRTGAKHKEVHLLWPEELNNMTTDTMRAAARNRQPKAATHQEAFERIAQALEDLVDLKRSERENKGVIGRLF